MIGEGRNAHGALVLAQQCCSVARRPRRNQRKLMRIGASTEAAGFGSIAPGFICDIVIVDRKIHAHVPP